MISWPTRVGGVPVDDLDVEAVLAEVDRVVADGLDRAAVRTDVWLRCRTRPIMVAMMTGTDS